VSVTGKVDGRYVDFDLTLSDWSEVCRWLGKKVDDSTLELFDTLCMSNVDVPSESIHKAIATARALELPERIDILINTIEHNVMDTAEHYTDDDLYDPDEEDPSPPDASGSDAPGR
jgi:hypothetical protein